MQIAFSETLPFFSSFLTKAITLFGIRNGSVLFSGIQQLLHITVYCVSFFLPALFIFKFSDNSEKPITFKASFPKHTPLLFVGVLGCVSLSGGITNIIKELLSKIGIAFRSHSPDVPDNIWLIVLLFVSSALAPAIFEEILFRKAVLNALLPYGNRFALILSSLSFSLMHKNLAQFLYTFVGGLFFGVIAIKCRSVVPTIILHFLNNSLAITYLLIEKYAPIQTYIFTVSTIETVLKISGTIFLLILLNQKRRKIENDIVPTKDVPLKNALSVFSITFVVYCLYFSKDWIYFI